MTMSFNTKAGLAAALLAAGTSAANAAVLINPGGSAALGATLGSAAIASVSWSGTQTSALLDQSSLPFGQFGYYVDASNNQVVDGLFDNAPVHIGLSTAPAAGGTYYLATSNNQLALNALLTGATYKSVEFTLVPEPGTYAMLAGLGLVAFAGYRRMGS